MVHHPLIHPQLRHIPTEKSGNESNESDRVSIILLEDYSSQSTILYKLTASSRQLNDPSEKHLIPDQVKFNNYDWFEENSDLILRESGPVLNEWQSVWKSHEIIQVTIKGVNPKLTKLWSDIIVPYMLRKRCLIGSRIYDNNSRNVGVKKEASFEYELES